MQKLPEKIRNMEHLFVYGTLMRGGRLHHLLRPSPGVAFAGTARIRGLLYRLARETYPGAVATSQRNRFVYGELYGLRDARALFQRLDEAEGCGEGLFVRRQVEVFRQSSSLRAWTYLYARPLCDA